MGKKSWLFALATVTGLRPAFGWGSPFFTS
jgi:hypothetical protein